MEKLFAVENSCEEIAYFKNYIFRAWGGGQLRLQSE